MLDPDRVASYFRCNLLLFPAAHYTKAKLDKALTELLTDATTPGKTPMPSEAEAAISRLKTAHNPTREEHAADAVSFAQKHGAKQTLATLTLGQAPRRDLHPLLLEHLPEESIAHFGLLDGLSTAEIEHRYAPKPGEKVAMTHMEDGSYVVLSAARVEAALQQLIGQLESQGFETILLLCSGEYKNLVAESAVLLEPYTILPPLVNAITGGHQVGIVVAREEYLGEQAYKWQSLSSKPHYVVANPWQSTDRELMDAALLLQEQGADVVVLDCLGFHQRHRDFLQKMLGIPVLLSNTLMAKLAAELVG